MADFDYTFRIVYDPNSGNYSYASDNGSGTLTDGDGGSTAFEATDTISGGGPTDSGEYLGTVTVNGTVFVAVETATPGGTISLYGPEDLGAFPTATGTLSPAPQVVSAPLTVCFAAGTQIATPNGARSIEELEVGDFVSTQDGGAVPVLWIGHQTVTKLFTPAERFVPVRVKAGALGEGLPYTDLILTADHALILEGLAINAGALVNGDEIRYEPIDALPDRATYFHIETEHHDVIFANGAAAETYVDDVARSHFDNYDKYLMAYGADRVIRENALPRISAARLVPPAILARLRRRAAA